MDKPSFQFPSYAVHESKEKERGHTARSYVALSCALEEEAHDKDLQRTHADDQPALD